MSRTAHSEIASLASFLLFAGLSAPSLGLLVSCSPGAEGQQAASPQPAATPQPTAAPQPPSEPAKSEPPAASAAPEADGKAAAPAADDNRIQLDDELVARTEVSRKPSPGKADSLRRESESERPRKGAVQAARAETPGGASSGKLAPIEIQRVVRANFGPLRACYEDGLKKNPNLQGRIAVRFVIDTSGQVISAESAQSKGSTSPADPLATQPSLGPMPDPNVVSCIMTAFKKLRFPSPEGGKVTVVYPLMFSAAP